MAGYYKLSVTLTKNLADMADTKDFTKFAVSPQSGDSISLKDGKKAEIALVSLEFTKEIYRPCTIDAELSITVNFPAISDLRDAFKGATANLTAGNDGTGTDFCNNFEVVDCVTDCRYSGGGGTVDSIRLRLNICSPDYVLENRCYSSAHTGKRLSSIISSALDEFGKKNILDTNLRYLQYRRVTAENSSLGLMPWDELLQPYLVQYNETFYSFARRTASRCGEFLYYEKGKLRLGLAASADKVKRITSFSSVRFSNLKRGEPQGGVNSWHRDPIGGSATAVSGFGSYNMEASCDEYLKAVNKENYDSTSAEYDTRFAWLDDTLTPIFGSTSLLRGLLKAGEAIGINHISAWHYSNDENNAFKDLFFNKNEDACYSADVFDAHYDRLQGSDTGAKCVTPFSTHPNHNISNVRIQLDNAFYSTIREVQEKLWDNAVEVDMGTNLEGIGLGDRIMLYSKNGETPVSSTEFIVVKVCGGDRKENGNWMESLMLTAIPDLKTKSKGVNGNEEINPPIPPSTGEELVRRSGPQTAKIVQHNLDPERKGRVRIRYYWQNDRTDGDSPWIRVCQMAASNGYGTHFIPTEGDEALIMYENGNVERPYVAGYLRNKDRKSPYEGRAYADVFRNSSGQTLRMTESHDMGNFLGGAMPLLNLLRTPYMFTINADTDPGNYLNGATEFTDAYGLYSFKMSSQERKITMKSPLGSVETQAFTGINVSAPSGDITICGKNINISAGNNLTLTSGTNITDKYQIHSEAKDKGLAIGRAIADKALAQFLDMSLLRCALEMFIYPVGGTLEIKSNRFLIMEAGKGHAVMPDIAYTKADEANDSDAALVKAWAGYRIAADLVSTYCDSVNEHTRILYMMKLAYDFKNEGQDIIKASSPFNYENIVKDAVKSSLADDVNFFTVEKFPEESFVENQLIQDHGIVEQDTITSIYQKANQIHHTVRRIMGRYKAITDNLALGNAYHLKKTSSAFSDKDFSKQMIPTAEQLDAWNGEARFFPTEKVMELRRRALVAYLKATAGDLGWAVPKFEDENYTSQNKWEEAVGKITKLATSKNFLSLLQRAAASIKATFSSMIQGSFWSGDKDSWSANSNGTILMSQTPSQTISFNGGDNNGVTRISTIEHTLPDAIQEIKAQGNQAVQ